MFNDLRSVRVRRLLYLVSTALVVIAVGARALLGGEDGAAGVLRELTSNVAGAIIVWALGIFFIGFFFARERQSQETQVIDGDASAKRFLRSANDSTIWFHHGQIGRWVRENAVPALIARSARSPAPLRMVVILIDPQSHELCKAHADRRNSRRRKESTPFTAQHIKSEIVSTILALAKAQATIPGFTATVFVSELDLPFRVDLCDNYGYITHEDQTAPAFGFEKDSPYFATAYGYFDKFATPNFRAIDFSAVESDMEGMDAKSIQGILTRLDLDFPELAKDKVREMIVKSVQKVVR